jgi:putative redox protein
VDNHGKGEAFSPTDLVCVALANCIITTIGIWANQENIDLKGTHLEITKTMQTSPRKIAEAGIVIYVSNKALTAEQKQRMEHIAHACPVAKSLHPDLLQNVRFEW